MANTKSAKKEVRKTLRRTERNKAIRSTLKTFSKKLKGLQSAKKLEEAKTVAIDYISALDKAAKNNVLHANKVSRIKSQLAECVFAKAEAKVSAEN